jgi:hypothetical protein
MYIAGHGKRNDFSGGNTAELIVSISERKTAVYAAEKDLKEKENENSKIVHWFSGGVGSLGNGGLRQ